jgi:hypothetical protein
MPLRVRFQESAEGRSRVTSLPVQVRHDDIPTTEIGEECAPCADVSLNGVFCDI